MRPVDFKTAFLYPFNKASRMWNILWVLLPIFGWLALAGYQVRIVNEFVRGRFKHLPKMTFKSDLRLGFWIVVKAIPFWLVFMLVTMLAGMLHRSTGSFVQIFLSLFIVPIMTIHYFQKRTVESYFDLRQVNMVKRNLGEYLLVLLKSFGLATVFLLLTVVLVGFPAGQFTKNLFVADFYRRRK